MTRSADREAGAAGATALPVFGPPGGEAPGEVPFHEAEADLGRLDLLALLPCPLKVPIEEAFLDFARDRVAGGARPLAFTLSGQVNHERDLFRIAAAARTPAELPGALVSPGLNALFRPPFAERFLRSGALRAPTPSAGPKLSAAGLLDPAGRAAVLCANVLVLVIDEHALGARPAPRRVADLLEPDFTGSVAIRGDGAGMYCETLLLSLYRRFGLEGVRRLARATRHGWHPSRMVKTAGSRSPEAPAVSVMPLFFARTLRGRAGVRVVWPEDGAVVSPVTLLVRDERAEALADLVGFLSGPQVARICSGASFPALHPEVPDELPDPAPLDWIGWEFVWAHDLGRLLAEITALFPAGRRPGAP